MKTNKFTITNEYLLKMLQSPYCDYKSLNIPVFIRHHGRGLDRATAFDCLDGYPEIIMLAKDPNCAKEVLDAYPNVKWAREYYTDGKLINSQKGAWDYCRDHGIRTCVLLDDDLRDFCVSFYGLEENKMHLSSQKYFPFDNKEMPKRILAYCIRRADALFNKHPDVGMVGWHHRSFGYLYQNCNVVDINGGYNDFANGYIYNIEAMDRFGFSLPQNWDDHGDNVGIYCDMLNRGMEMACLTGACISPNNDGDRSTLRTADDAKTKTEADWNNCQKLVPKIMPGLRRQKTGEQYVKINWKDMNKVTGHTHTQERLFYNPDDYQVNPIE